MPGCAPASTTRWPTASTRSASWRSDDERLARLLDDLGDSPPPESVHRHHYFKELLRLQRELIRLQDWVVHKGLKVVVLFEGRDAAGKGGVIKRVSQRLNPRVCRTVALSAPTERERSQWYFQRYVAHLPAAGEIVLFDRSWYNRAGVERVMGFCPAQDVEEFFRTVPEFERMLVRSGIILIKYWFSITDEEQNLRFLMRIHDPLKQWKLSPMDLESRRRWEEYTKAKEEMLAPDAHPRGALVGGRGVDKKAARLNCIHHLLQQIPYRGRARVRRSCCRCASTSPTITARRSRRRCTCRGPTDHARAAATPQIATLPPAFAGGFRIRSCRSRASDRRAPPRRGAAPRCRAHSRSRRTLRRRVDAAAAGARRRKRPVGRAPTREGIDLDMRRISLEHRQVEPGRRLETLASGDPGVEAGQGTLQRLGLAEGAAAVGVPYGARGIAIQPRGLFGRRSDASDIAEPEMRRQRVAIAQRLGEVAAGVDEEHGRSPVDRGDEVQQDGGFRAE